MNYQDIINEFFDKYKQTKKLHDIKEKAKRKIRVKYMSLKDKGYTDKEALYKIKNEMNQLKQTFPMLTSMPKKGMDGGMTEMKSLVIVMMMFLVLVTGSYALNLLVGGIVQLFLSVIMIVATTVIPANTYQEGMKKFVTGLWFLLLAECIGIPLFIILNDFTNEYAVGFMIVYPLAIIFFGLLVLYVRNKQDYTNHLYVQWFGIEADTVIVILKVVFAIGYFVFSLFLFFTSLFTIIISNL